MNKNNGNLFTIHKTLNLDKSSEKNQIQEILNILRWAGFLILPLSFLYDEYIDRPKLTEQKPISVLVPPPLKWSRNKNCMLWYYATNNKLTNMKHCIVYNFRRHQLSLLLASKYCAGLYLDSDEVCELLL